MALTIEISPVRDFVENLAGEATAVEWLWQAGVVAAAVLLGWYATRVIRREIISSSRWKFGAGEFRRVAVPVLAVCFLWAGKLALGQHQTVVLLDIVQSLLVALALIRFAEYVLSHILPRGKGLHRAVRIIAWGAWIGAALHLTGLLPQVLESLDSIGFTLGRTEITLLDVLKGAAAMVLTIALSLWISRITEGRVMASESMDVTTRVVIAKVVRVAALFLAVFIALPLAGIDVTTLSIFSGAVGVGLGFGLQKIASNYVSGFIVLVERSLRIGDVVTVDGRRGEVTAIEARFTVIKGADGAESLIPNEKMITEIVTHHTYSDPRVSLTVAVWISYDSDVDVACAQMLAAAKRQARVIADPAAAARVKQLGDHGIELELTLWIRDPSQGEGDLKSELLKDVLRSFKAHAIEIPYPRRDVRVFATPATQESSSPPRS
ncbi:MAG: mechanosensitive ion channel family protein [Usitatibacter sp.]